MEWKFWGGLGGVEGERVFVHICVKSSFCIFSVSLERARGAEGCRSVCLQCLPVRPACRLARSASSHFHPVRRNLTYALFRRKFKLIRLYQSVVTDEVGPIPLTNEMGSNTDLMDRVKNGHMLYLWCCAMKHRVFIVIKLSTRLRNIQIRVR